MTTAINQTAEAVLAAEIRLSFEQATASATTAKANVGHALQEAIRCGGLLATAKANYGAHGKWLPWLTTNCPGIHRTTAARWLRLAAGAERLGEATSQREGLQCLGLLEPFTREPGTQTAAAPSCKWLSALSRAAAELQPFADDPAVVMGWGEPERHLLKSKLEPLVRLHAALES